MTGSGRGSSPPGTPCWGRIAALATDPAMGLHRRSGAAWAARTHAIFPSGATTGAGAVWGPGR